MGYREVFNFPSSAVKCQMPRVVIVRGKNPYRMVQKGLAYFEKPSQEKIVLKPNLINSQPPPTTTPCETIEALVKHYHKDYEVVIAEGSGWSDTFHAYETLGYRKIAEKYGVKLVDLNNDDYEMRKEPNALSLKEFKFPLTLKNSYIISVPVIKEHFSTTVTISLKNMLGATLGKKWRFHARLNESIVDINLYLKPNLTVVDGRIAGLGGELRASPKTLGLMMFSEDLVAADAIGAGYLNKNPLLIKHLQLAQEKGLGIADPKKIEVVEVREK